MIPRYAKTRKRGNTAIRELFITGGSIALLNTERKRINGQIQRTRCKSGLLHQRLSNTGQTKPRRMLLVPRAFAEKRFRLLSIISVAPFAVFSHFLSVRCDDKSQVLKSVFRVPLVNLSLESSAFRSMHF